MSTVAPVFEWRCFFAPRRHGRPPTGLFKLFGVSRISLVTTYPFP